MMSLRFFCGARSTDLWGPDAQKSQLRHRRNAAVVHQHMEAALQLDEAVEDEIGVDEQRLCHARQSRRCGPAVEAAIATSGSGRAWELRLVDYSKRYGQQPSPECMEEVRRQADFRCLDRRSLVASEHRSCRP